MDEEMVTMIDNRNLRAIVHELQEEYFLQRLSILRSVKSLREPVIEVLEKKWEDYKHGIFT